MRVIATTLLLLAGIGQAVADDEAVKLAVAPELIREESLYTVEVVIFKQAEADKESETWPADLESIEFTNAELPLVNDGEPLALNEELPITTFALTEQANRLAQKGYELLYHNSWLDQFKPGANRTTLLLDAFGNFEGTLRIERQRYLHIYPSINYYPNGLSLTDEPAETIRFEESRRMRSKDLHYIDHPVLGMLVLFRPIEAVEMEVTDLVTSTETANTVN
ncbi:hypothetical protein XMG59_000334 [Marinobacterium sp. xm-g-59]|uniref:CsiV family protein n=1 Tax=Marinobacterium sp. xm-g-59 TaxID=2497748 RepID=UPI00156A165D|nr:hypothetical protein [Marinobacterium sp. xm-g-59]